MEYESAAGRREIACLEQIPSLLPPENPDAVHTPETYIPTRERKIKAAQCYLKLLDHILPPGTPLSARIWHDNLTLDNIFVYPKNELDICGILDWRFTEIAPFYSHTLEPNYFDTDGPSHQEAKRVGVTLNTTQMKAENERTKEYLKASLRNWAEEKNKRMLSVLGFQDSSKYDIMRLARNVLVEDEAILFHELLQFSKTAMDAGVPSSVFEEDPFNFTEPACRRIQEDMSRAMEGHNLMRKYKEKVGPKFFKNHGLASHVQFGKIQKDLQGQKKDFFRSLPHLRKSLKRTWPFGR